MEVALVLKDTAFAMDNAESMKFTKDNEYDSRSVTINEGLPGEVIFEVLPGDKVIVGDRDINNDECFPFNKGDNELKKELEIKKKDIDKYRETINRMHLDHKKDLDKFKNLISAWYNGESINPMIKELRLEFFPTIWTGKDEI